jgi:hypothetical protein
MDVDIKSPSPLAFDRVMEGRAVADHNSPLFKIPTEILTIIISHLVAMRILHRLLLSTRIPGSWHDPANSEP